MLNRIGSKDVQIQSYLPTGNPEVGGNKGASRGGEDCVVPLEHGCESSDGGTSSWQSQNVQSNQTRVSGVVPEVSLEEEGGEGKEGGGGRRREGGM